MVVVVAAGGGAAARLVALGLVAPPPGPGVYAFRDATGALLYIGASRDLPTRVRSYFAPRHTVVSKAGRIVRLARHVEWRPADSVLEALVDEAHAIRTERPFFNRRLKQTGHYAYLRFDTRDAFPRLEPTRLLVDGPWRHLGPFPGGRRLRGAVERVADAFGLRTCAGVLRPDPGARACIRLDLGQCAGPCVGRVAPGGYGRQVVRALAVLGGGDQGTARRCGARSAGPPPPLPAPVWAAVRALREARARTALLVVLPARGAAGHRLLAVSGGRVVGAASTAPAGLRPAFDCLRALLTVPPPALLPRDALDEVRIVTAWLASREGRAATVEVAGGGFDAAWHRVLALTMPAKPPGPLFAVRSAGR